MSDNKVEVTVLSNTVNSPVIQFPGRRFPGVLIQGDSLRSMTNLVNVIGECLRIGDIEEARSVAVELDDVLGSHIKHYEAVLDAHGLTLPYPFAS